MLQPRLRYFLQRNCTNKWKLNDEQPSDVYSLFFVLDGDARFTVDGEYFELGTGDVLFTKPGEVRVGRTDGMELAVVCYDLEGEEKPELRELFTQIKYEWVQQELQCSEGGEMNSTALLLQLFYRLLYKYDPKRRKQFRYIDTIKRYVVEHYTDDLSMEQLANLVGLNHVYLGVSFKDKEGISLVEYVTRVRLNAAADLLLSKEYSIKEVAEKVGYNDVYYFSNSFKKHYGIAPSRYTK